MSKSAKVLVGTAVLILVILIVASFSPNRDKGETTNLRAPAPGAVPARPVAAEDPVTGLLGARLTLDGLAVTTGTLVEGEPFLRDPRTCMNVVFTNEGDDNADLNQFDWTLQDANGVIHNTTVGGTDNELVSGALAPGGNTRGDVCFDVKLTEGPWTLTYQPNMFIDDNKLTWTSQ